MTSAPSRQLRALRLLGLALAASLALLFPGMPNASADDVLVGSNPEDGATLDAGPDAVQLDFDEEVQELGAQVVITAADGRAVADGDPQIDGSTVVQALAADLPGGDYTVDWRVTSADGHPVSGVLSFTVAGGAASSSSAAPSSSAATGTTDVGEAAATTDSGSSTTTWLVVGAVVVLAAAIALGVRGLRRRS